MMAGMPAWPCLDRPVPYVLAHRGFDLTGLENSMKAFEAAVALGAEFLETDVHATADGVLLAFHDERLDRVTDAAGVVTELRWEVVRHARIGGREPIPLLADVLGTWPHVAVNVDLKSAGAVAPFVEVVRRAGARERVVVASFSDRRRADAVAALEMDGPVAWSPGSGGVARLVGAVRTPGRRARAERVRRALRGAACVQVPERYGMVRIVTPALVDAVHAAGAQVHVWTVDDPADMRRLLDLGVDALVTNRADLALDVLRGGGGAA